MIRMSTIFAAAVTCSAMLTPHHADATPQFPLEVSFSECFEDWCMGTQAMVMDDGTIHTWDVVGHWRFQNGTFFMRFEADYDGDATLDHKVTYRGTRVDNCMQGDAYDHISNLFGSFSLCS